MTLEELNQLSPSQSASEISRCCGASAWVRLMVESLPFSSKEELLAAGDLSWSQMLEEDWLEAFTHHPRIGSDLEKLREKFASTESWSKSEQQSVNEATEKTLKKLNQGNIDYEKKFGFIFIVCATGKSVDKMLKLLEARIENDRDEELKIAANEQRKILMIRLEKLL